jgi:hypothetical protein
MKPKIEGAIIQSGRTYKAGDEDALAAVLSPENVQRLVRKGALSGNWVQQKEAEPSAPAEVNAEPSEAPAKRAPTRRRK